MISVPLKSWLPTYVNVPPALIVTVPLFAVAEVTVSVSPSISVSLPNTLISTPVP